MAGDRAKDGRAFLPGACWNDAIGDRLPESNLKIETDRVRVTEWRLLPGDQTGYHRHEYDYVVVPLTGGELTMEDASGNSIKFVTAMG